MVKRRVKKVNKRKNLFEESYNYLSECRNYVIAAVLFFFGSALVSFLFPVNFTFYNELLKDIVDKTEGLNPGELIWFIFKNNTSSAFTAMILGIGFGVFPVFNALLNGSVLGYVMALVVGIKGVSSIFLLLPHGIFELPAIFISLGLGMKWGLSIISKDRKIEFRRCFYGSVKVFLTIVLPLLAIAAVIEGFLIVFG